MSREYTPQGLVKEILKQNKWDRDTKIMYHEIFIGSYNPATNEEIKPSIRYLQNKWNNIPADEVELIGQKAFIKLVNAGRKFGWKYFQRRVDLDCMNYLESNKREERLLEKAHHSSEIKINQFRAEDGEVITEYYHDPEEKPEIAWKQPLTRDEQTMASALMAGMSQRDITEKLKIHPRDQVKIKAQLKTKMEII